MSLLLARVMHMHRAAPVVGDYEATVLADSPIAYWHCGDTGSVLADSSGNGHNGTFGGTCLKGQTSILPNGYGKSLDFGSTVGNAAVNVPKPFNVPLTLEGWIKSTALSYQNFIISFAAGSSNCAGMFAQYGTLTLNNAGVSNTLAPVTGNITINKSAHCVITVTSTVASFYLNGILLGTVTGSWSFSDTHAGGTIGGYNGNMSVAGKVQEIAVYNKVLTATQIAAHYAAAN